ncbi:uncharacterized protein LOC110449818 [Mizuhopecten yessoensis]|uniref:uncharacterized protein LOC110449818 n=1 Tax=Mizuhopecten yessoensis TaxID=6573 RepID=UPI000B45F04B|nr:uncharacterized protein LOC110449818 [Mizuhopecten yessoensis]
MALKLPCALGRVLYRQHLSPKHLVKPVITREFHITPKLGTVVGMKYATPEIKQMLVRMKFFKKVEHVPDFVGSGLVSLANDYFRVKMSMSIMNVLFLTVYTMFFWVRRKKSKQFEERTNTKYEAHRTREIEKKK